LLIGCASAPQTADEAMKKLESDDQMIAANVPENYRQQIADKFRLTLKDPYSIRDATISRPAVSWAGLIHGDRALPCAPG